MIAVSIVGAGHMGSLHAATVAAHPLTHLHHVFDRHPERAASLAAAHGARVGPPEGDLVIVATPASSHVEVAEPLLGTPLLVEKPLAPRAPDAARLVRDGVYVGHSERFHPSLRGIRDVERLRTVRHAPPSSRGRDVDAIADLLVHDLDLMRTWMGSMGLKAVGGDLKGPLERVRVCFQGNRTHALLEVDRCAEGPVRWVETDGVAHDLRGPHGSPDALTAQLDAILHALGHPTVARAPVATAADGHATVELADRVRAGLRGLWS